MEIIFNIFGFISSLFKTLLSLGLWLTENIVLAIILLIVLFVAMLLLRFVAGVLKTVIIVVLVVFVLSLLLWLIPVGNEVDIDPSSPFTSEPVFNNSP